MTLPAIRQRPQPQVSIATNELSTFEQLMLEAAVGMVAHEFDIDRNDLVSPRRHPHLVQARAALAWALRRVRTPYSYTVIGTIIGERHHTSIIWLEEKAILLRCSDTAFRDMSARILARVRLLRCER